MYNLHEEQIFNEKIRFCIHFVSLCFPAGLQKLHALRAIADIDYSCRIFVRCTEITRGGTTTIKSIKI